MEEEGEGESGGRGRMPYLNLIAGLFGREEARRMENSLLLLSDGCKLDA